MTLEKLFESSPPSTEPIALFKQNLATARAQLAEQFRSGSNITRLIAQYTQFIDLLLSKAWSIFITDEDCSLVALGGYGRRELSLMTDIDIMVLHPETLQQRHQRDIQNFLNFLWDIGLKIGDSVRTKEACQKKAAKDIIIMTSLLDSRLICGNPQSYQKMQTLISDVWSHESFLQGKLIEQEKRHKKYHDSEHRLEPHIKESPGGLRDIHIIEWISKKYFQDDRLDILVTKALLSAEEYMILNNARHLLWRIRFALHILRHACDDRLLFDVQRDVSKILRFYGRKNAGVEAFMRLYFKNTLEVSRLNEILLQHFRDIILPRAKPNITPINKRFTKRGNMIEVNRQDTFKRYPFSLLEIFLLLQEDHSIVGISAKTIQIIRKNLHIIDTTFHKDIRHRMLFVEIIKKPYVEGVLRLMYRYGVLGAYLPCFAKVEGLMQFDMFHIYTVEEHSLMVIREMEKFQHVTYREKFPLCRTIIQTLPKLEILYIAGLFHDIAKGRHGDHSKLGAKEAQDFCHLHQFSQYDTELIVWLVKHHLLMSKVAQREDLEDFSTIDHFAKTVGDDTRLNYLYVLTVADILGTNPTLWSSWKNAILIKLYRQTKYHIHRDGQHPILGDQYVQQIKADALEKLKGSSKQKVQAYWDEFGKDYFLRHSVAEIAWHIQAVIAHEQQADTPLVLIKRKSEHGGSLIFIYTRDGENLFVIMTKTLEQLGLNIVAAKIITSRDNYALDSYTILERGNKLIQNQQRAEEIKIRLIQALTNQSQTMPALSEWLSRRKLKQFQVSTEINFQNDPENNRTIMDITTLDRPGILSCIGMAMVNCDIKLLGAKIATYGERAEDVFYLRNKRNLMISDPEKLETLERTIKDILGP